MICKKCGQDKPLMRSGLCGTCMYQIGIEKKIGVSTTSFFNRVNQEAGVQNLPAVQDPNQVGMTEVPIGIQQMGNAVKSIMPMVEEITGLNRKEITLNLLKSGLKGNNIVDILTGLANPKPTPQAKIISTGTAGWSDSFFDVLIQRDLMKDIDLVPNHVYAGKSAGWDLSYGVGQGGRG